MHYHLLTRNLFYSLFCFALLSLNSVAFGQVYKSYDAEGNVIFSDKPTQDSREVEVTKPNVSDSFEIPPPPPPAETPPENEPETDSETEPEPEPVTEPIMEYDPADTNKDGRISRREKEEERKERRRKKRELEEAAEGNEE